MYAIYGNIYHQYTPNVSIYTIHGSYGNPIKNSYDVLFYRPCWVSPRLVGPPPPLLAFVQSIAKGSDSSAPALRSAFSSWGFCVRRKYRYPTWLSSVSYVSWLKIPDRWRLHCLENIVLFLGNWPLRCLITRGYRLGTSSPPGKTMESK